MSIIATKSFSLNGTAPYNWSVSSSNTCAVPAPTSGTCDTDVLVLTFEFENEECFNNVNFDLNVTSACGYLAVYNNFTVENPCTNFALGDITLTGYLGFSIATVFGTSPFSYQWIYDTNIFQLSAGNILNSPTLALQLIEGVASLPDTTVISVIVTDANGCEGTESLVYDICDPLLGFEAITLDCIPPPEVNPTGTTGLITSMSAATLLDVRLCSGTTTKWATLEFSGVPANVFPIHNGSGQITIYANSDATVGSSYLFARVKDSNGSWSNLASILITVPLCDESQSPLTLAAEYVFVAGEPVVASTYEVDINSRALGNESPIDWDTFTFVAGTGQTLVSPTSLTTAFGDVILSPGRIVKYTITTVPTTTPKMDIVMWRVKDENGYYTQRGRIHYDYNVATAPTAVADTMCASCGSTTIKDLLANDTGDIDPRSVVITTAPTKGSYTVDSESFIFTALLQTSGSDVPQYKVANYDGDYSSSVNITITIVCAGEDNSATICPVTVDFTDYLSSWATASCAWVQTSGTSTIGLGTPSAVNFAAATPDTYTFTYTCTSGSCSDVMNLTVELKTASANDLCADADVLVFPSTVGVQGEIIACDGEESIQSPASTVQNPSTWDTTRSGDVWFKFTTVPFTSAGAITVTGTPFGILGVRNPQIQLLKDSGSVCTVNDFTTISNGAEISGGQSKTLSFTGLTASTVYYIRVSTGEYLGSATGGVGKFLINISGV